jgi:hypothetical protein
MTFMSLITMRLLVLNGFVMMFIWFWLFWMLFRFMLLFVLDWGWNRNSWDNLCFMLFCLQLFRSMLCFLLMVFFVVEMLIKGMEFMSAILENSLPFLLLSLWFLFRFRSLCMSCLMFLMIVNFNFFFSWFGHMLFMLLFVLILMLILMFFFHRCVLLMFMLVRFVFFVRFLSWFIMGLFFMRFFNVNWSFNRYWSSNFLFRLMLLLVNFLRWFMLFFGCVFMLIFGLFWVFGFMFFFVLIRLMIFFMISLLFKFVMLLSMIIFMIILMIILMIGLVMLLLHNWFKFLLAISDTVSFRFRNHWDLSMIHYSFKFLS